LLKGKQRVTQLTEQSVFIVTSINGVDVWILIAKVKLEDVASLVAAPDASPPAAISAVP